MAISATQSSFFSSQSGGNKAPKQEMDQEAFLKLLVAQLKHQDPLKPMEDVEFIGQLTQFSNLEQVMQTNQKLEELALASTTQVSSQAINLVGRTVVAPTDQVALGPEGSIEMKVEVPETIVSGELNVVNEQGMVVRRIPLNGAAPGMARAVWDGRDMAGNRLPEGNYRIEAVGVSPVGAEVPMGVMAPARVDAVVWQDGVPMLRVGERLMPLSQVREVWP